MLKLKQLVLFSMIATLAACGGSGTSDDIKEVLFSVDTSANIGISEDSSTYQVTYYLNANGEKGDLVFGPVEAVQFNVEENLYSSRVTGLLDGDYIVDFQLVLNNETEDEGAAQTSDEVSIVLASISKEITLNGVSTDVDLSQDEWDSLSFDLDGDGSPNFNEVVLGTDLLNEDTDGDGVLDGADGFPIDPSESFDFDGDSIGDNKDLDADNDGLSNSEEVALGSNPLNSDTDGDGVLDSDDNCILKSNSGQSDTDKDGFGDACDNDDDNDGLSDAEEQDIGSDPKNSDSDNDGTIDGEDAFPLDSNESLDTDNDGVGNNTDTDDDGDGVSDVDEALAGSDPLDTDTDDDGVDDSLDNCPALVNVSQTDNDGDGIGDDCDEDDDNDGLSDAEELSIGTDGFITNAFQSDSDADGFSDSFDNCPNDDNIGQGDVDGDGFGTVCDCNDNDDTINQLAADLPDPSILDSNCDGIDGNKYEAVFVSTDGTAEVDSTDESNPTSDLNGAINYASQNGLSVFIETGDYNVEDLEILSNSSIYGGFGANFLSRDTSGTVSPTEFISSIQDEPVLSILDLENVVLSGLSLIDNSSSSNSILLDIENSDVFVESTLFNGTSVQSETLVQVTESEVNVTHSRFVGGANQNSIGVDYFDSEGLLKNNLFDMGQAEHTKGIVLSESDVLVVNNTIDAGQHTNGSVYGLVFEDSEPTILNNVFVTYNDRNSASISCTGLTPENAIDVQNNAFLRYSSNSLIFSAYSACSGDLLFDSADLSAHSEVNSSGNVFNTSSDLADLSNYLDENNDYSPVVAGSLVDAGQDTDSASKGEVVLDLLGNTRSTGSYDIGAVEL